MNLRKVILGSVIASTMVASASYADVNLIVGGNVDFQAGFRNEGRDYNYIDPFNPESGKRRKNIFAHDTNIEFKIFGHTDALNGFNYGGKIVFEADTSSSKYHLPQINITTEPFGVQVGNETINRGLDLSSVTFGNNRDFAYNENRNVREAMVFVEGLFGRFELGNTYGATKKMQIDAGTIAAGNGGIHGDTRLYIHPAPTFGNFSTPDFYTNRMAFYHVDNLFLPVQNALPYSTELATSGKISYYSPDFNGLQFGLTFIPDTDVHGTVANVSSITKNASPHGFGFENVIEGGFLYAGTFSDFDFKFSALGQKGKTKAPGGKGFEAFDRLVTEGIDDPAEGAKTYFEDLKGYEFGFATKFMGVGFAASYGHHDGLLSTLGANKYYTVGAGYEMGPWAFSVNYMDSNQKSRAFADSAGEIAVRKAEFNNLVFDVGYTFQGFMPYFSVGKYKAIKPQNGDNVELKNSGTVVLVGTKISF